MRMSDGKISGNTAVSTNGSTGFGGGLNLTAGSVADITGGTIENNQSNSGGGIYANGKSSFTASNLKITGNTAATKVSPDVVQASMLHELGRRKLLPEF